MWVLMSLTSLNATKYVYLCVCVCVTKITNKENINWERMRHTRVNGGEER